MHPSVGKGDRGTTVDDLLSPCRRECREPTPRRSRGTLEVVYCHLIPDTPKGGSPSLFSPGSSTAHTCGTVLTSGVPLRHRSLYRHHPCHGQRDPFPLEGK